jgi:DNA modification methylase
MNRIIPGNVLKIAKTLPTASVHCIVTSPPYWRLRDYGHADQIGLEQTPEAYVQTMVELFRELRRVLRDDGTLWLNLGDSYAVTGGSREYGSYDGTTGRGNGVSGNRVPPVGLPPKNLVGIPWRVALALQADGWILRSDIIWAKPNPMPESVTDRPTKAHEYIFLLAKSERYWYDAEAVKEVSTGRLPGNVSHKYVTEYGLSDDETHRTKAGLVAYSQNQRSKADSFKSDGSKREQTIPGQSYGTHRPDRAESEWDTATRNRRTVWAVATTPYSGAHFATFPPALIEPCILAGCPSQVCGECGKPWERVVDAEPYQQRGDYRKHAGESGHNNPTGKTPSSNTRGMPDRNKITLGFRPSCTCNAPTAAGVVLDPFMGSGTVAQVAIETGRNWLGIELNPEYIKLAEQRIAAAQPAMFTPSGEPVAIPAIIQNSFI